jgi:hypothetical protein
MVEWFPRSSDGSIRRWRMTRSWRGVLIHHDYCLSPLCQYKRNAVATFLDQVETGPLFLLRSELSSGEGNIIKPSPPAEIGHAAETCAAWNKTKHSDGPFTPSHCRHRTTRAWRIRISVLRNGPLVGNPVPAVNRVYVQFQPDEMVRKEEGRGAGGMRRHRNVQRIRPSACH